MQQGIFGSRYSSLNTDAATLAAPMGPATGKPLNCIAGRGTASFGGTWHDFSDTSFILQPGRRVNVPLARRRGQGAMLFQGVFDVEGQKIVFCPVVEGPPEKRISCASIYALDDDLKMGIKRTFDIPKAVRGGEISCAYDTGNLKKL